MHKASDMQRLWESGSEMTRRSLLAKAVAGGAGLALGSLAMGEALAQTPVANPFGEPETTGGTAILSALGRGNPRIFIPTSYYGTDAFFVAKLVFTPLLSLDRDWQNLGPAVAEEWTVSDDGTEVTLTLRQDIQFHDGTPLTANDVVFTYKLAVRADQYLALTDVGLLQGGTEYKDGTSDELPGVVAVDDYTVKFTLTSPSSVFLLKLSNCGILPAHKFAEDALAVGTIIDELPFFTWTDEPPIGTGPWKITEYDPESHLALAANETYFRGRPVLDELVLRIGMEAAAGIAALQSGEIDGLYTTPDSAKTLESDEAVELYVNTSMANEQVLITATEKEYLPVQVRQALMHALDVPTLLETVVYGYGEPAPSIMMHPSLFPNPDLPVYDFNPDRAKELLAEAGWDANRALNLGQFVADAAPSNVVAAVMSMWRDVGVNAEFTALDPANQVEISKSEDHPYDVVWTSFAWLAYDPSSAFQSFGSARRPNYSNFNNPEFDELMTEAIRQPTLEAAVPLYQQAQVILQTELPYAPVWITPEIWGINLKLHGGVLGRGPMNDIQSEKWWKAS